jgi:arylformamidase
VTLIDITRRLDERMPAWPGEPVLRRVENTSQERGDVANTSLLEGFTHTGTHIDSPFHFVSDGATLDGIDLDALVGPCRVCDHEPDRHVTAADLDAWSLDGVSRLLIRSTNRDRWRDAPHFRRDYVALESSAARWLAERHFLVVGVDYASVEPFDSPGHPVHRALLSAGVICLEGLDLDEVATGDYELIALPLRIADGDGSPVRAVLRSLPGGADV